MIAIALFGGHLFDNSKESYCGQMNIAMPQKPVVIAQRFHRRLTRVP